MRVVFAKAEVFGPSAVEVGNPRAGAGTAVDIRIIDIIKRLADAPIAIQSGSSRWRAEPYHMHFYSQRVAQEPRRNAFVCTYLRSADRASSTRRAGNRAHANVGGVWSTNTRIPSAQKLSATLGTMLRLTRLAG